MNYLPKSKSKVSILKFLISCAVQAPSSHNTQPWLFAIKNSKILVYADLTRNLKVGDPQNRELYASVGAAIANIELGAKALGISAKLQYFPDSKSRELVAVFDLIIPAAAKISYNEKLLKSLWERRSNRTHYLKSKELPAKHLAKLEKIANSYGLKLNLISDNKKITKIADMVKLGMIEFLSKPEFREELSHWVRHNWSKKGDGLPGYSIGMPGIISILAPVLVKSTAPIQTIAKEEKNAVESCPTVGVITVSKDTPINWVKTGVVFEHIAIESHLAGISTSILTAAVECPSQNIKLKKIVSSIPTLFFRLGYATGPGIAVPRRDGLSVMHPSSV